MSVLASDNFNRSNGTLGASWTTPTGGNALKISGNAVTFVTSSFDCMQYYSGISWPNDHYSQCTATVGASVGAGIGPSCRMSATATTRYRLTPSTAGSNNIELSKEVGGTFTLIWDRTSAFSNGNTIRLEAQGTTLRAYNAGVQIGANSTDSSIASGNAGILYSSSDTSAVADNFEGGDFSGATESSELIAARVCCSMP